VIGLGFSLYDLIDKSVELAKDNQVTEASKFLRDSARKIQDSQRKLQEQLDAIKYDIELSTNFGYTLFHSALCCKTIFF